jgi:hypothetical protein
MTPHTLDYESEVNLVVPCSRALVGSCDDGMVEGVER